MLPGDLGVRVREGKLRGSRADVMAVARADAAETTGLTRGVGLPARERGGVGRALQAERGVRWLRRVGIRWAELGRPRGKEGGRALG